MLLQGLKCGTEYITFEILFTKLWPNGLYLHCVEALRKIYSFDDISNMRFLIMMGIDICLISVGVWFDSV